MPPHRGHRHGIEVDIRPVRGDGREAPVSRAMPGYSRRLTQELVGIIRGNPVLPVTTIYFNDPQLSGVSLLVGHDDHLHVRFGAAPAAVRAAAPAPVPAALPAGALVAVPAVVLATVPVPLPAAALRLLLRDRKLESLVGQGRERAYAAVKAEVSADLEQSAPALHEQLLAGLGPVLRRLAAERAP